MSIISVTQLDNELPADASNASGEMTDAVSQATGFINTWTSMHYDPFDDYYIDPTSPSVEIAPAPAIVQRMCLEVAKAFYFMSVGERYRDGLEKTSWAEYLDGIKTDLKMLSVAPEWKTQTISLDTSNAMVIGSRSALGFWPRVIPQTAQVVSATTNIWIPPDDWFIGQGAGLADEYPGAWYFYGGSSSVEGTLRYMRTYRNDAIDYGRYADA